MSPRPPAAPAPHQPAVSAPWSRDEARLLLTLREAAGFNEAVFANANAISLVQLRALEDRGTSPFYSEQIKAQLGRRLLRRLGHTAELPAVTATSGATASEGQGPAPGTAPGTAPAPIPARETAPAPVHEAASASTGPSLAPVDEGDPFDIPPPHNRWARHLGVAALSLVAVVCGAWALGALQQQPAAPAPLATSSSPPPAAAENPDPIAALPASAAPADTPPKAAAAVPAPVDAGTCGPALRGQAIPFMPDRALKEPSYVHIEATGPVSLCVVDARDRSTSTELRAGESRSISGEPPFLVKIVPAKAARLYFQGARVAQAMDDSSPTLLQARTAP